MKTIEKSHLDHGLPKEVFDHIFELFGDRNSFFIETITLPDHLPSVTCALHGPDMGDAPIDSSECWYARRPGRKIESRLCDRRLRDVRVVTVIAGPVDVCLSCGSAGSCECKNPSHKHEDCVLYTAFGGPLAPKETNDPFIKDEQERLASVHFWSQHALSAPIPMIFDFSEKDWSESLETIEGPEGERVVMSSSLIKVGEVQAALDERFLQLVERLKTPGPGKANKKLRKTIRRLHSRSSGNDLWRYAMVMSQLEKGGVG